MVVQPSSKRHVVDCVDLPLPDRSKIRLAVQSSVSEIAPSRRVVDYLLSGRIRLRGSEGKTEQLFHL
jgi:hypothetical protein